MIATVFLAIAFDPTCDESLRLRIECVVEELCLGFVGSGKSHDTVRHTEFIT